MRPPSWLMNAWGIAGLWLACIFLMGFVLPYVVNGDTLSLLLGTLSAVVAISFAAWVTSEVAKKDMWFS